jgi:hypothetical protein
MSENIIISCKGILTQDMSDLKKIPTFYSIKIIQNIFYLKKNYHLFSVDHNFQIISTQEKIFEIFNKISNNKINEFDLKQIISYNSEKIEHLTNYLLICEKNTDTQEILIQQIIEIVDPIFLLKYKILSKYPKLLNLFI